MTHTATRSGVRGAALGFALLLGFALTGTACGGAATPDAPVRPTIVLITLDTTRADHLSTYGYARVTDPNLARLAAESLVYEVGVPSATWTLPSHVSLFSGVAPPVHGCWSHGTDAEGEAQVHVPSPDLPFFTGPLRAAGYHLIGAVGGPFTSARYGLARDFDAYLEPTDTWELPATALNAWIVERLAERPRDRPLCLFVNYFDAHAPYAPPADREYPFPPGVGPLEPVPELRAPVPPELLARAIDQYDRELLVQDEALGSLLDALRAEGLLDNALVIVTADHGEAFGEQPGIYGHGCPPFEPVARVPVVLYRAPGGPIGRREQPISISNIAQTILAAVGLDPLPPDGGPPRFDLLGDDVPTLPPYVEHRSPEEWIGALRGTRYKYAAILGPEGSTRRGEEIVLDLATNPTERLELAVELAAQPAGLDELTAFRRVLASMLAGWKAPPDDLPTATLSPEERAALEQLGYF